MQFAARSKRRESSLVLLSEGSLDRRWINFEAGSLRRSSGTSVILRHKRSRQVNV